MESKEINLLIGGEAGQGLVTIGELLAKSLVRSGYFIVVTQSYHSRIRGGHNTYAIRASGKKIVAPREAVDLLVALNPETVALHKSEISAGGLTIVDTAFKTTSDKCLQVPYLELGEKQFSNVVALGVVSFLLGLELEMVGKALDDAFGKKAPEIAEKNMQILQESYRWCSHQGVNFSKLAPASDIRRRLLMNGNEAIAMGALSAGVKFCSFYPMTPATSIALNLAAQASTMGLVVEQAEDEIAAINMAIGASFAGAPSIVPTSGGGFALMTEGVSLAGMSETPLVIVVAQRPGPATGLPTRTEQADLELVLHSGHGEFPRAIFSPGTVEECFWLTRKAFEVAAKSQGPVFILTDQFLADSARAIEPFDLEGLETVRVGIVEDSADLPYFRYPIYESGISPRLLPGMGKHLVVAGGDEHPIDGHLTEDLSVRKFMVEKRLRKEEEIVAEVVPPEIQGDEKPDLLLVTWGTTKGAILEAAAKLRNDSTRVGTLHFSQVWPLVPQQFLEVLQDAGEVVCVEGNAFGQLARLIRRETGFNFHRRVLRYDGLPITPEYILRALERS
ncbi:MAG: 2-oxoacid:acceptor oxidoreductase subunit alpha [Deltaproteobacteria bacterium]|nr:MAG: 2-oxoacid:acceptor oxidoreductase subunit alpha [Deltaproteobacteria bacterium]